MADAGSNRRLSAATRVAQALRYIDEETEKYLLKFQAALRERPPKA